MKKGGEFTVKNQCKLIHINLNFSLKSLISSFHIPVLVEYFQHFVFVSLFLLDCFALTQPPVGSVGKVKMGCTKNINIRVKFVNICECKNMQI